jgi:hypothetical protein
VSDVAIYYFFDMVEIIVHIYAKLPFYMVMNVPDTGLFLSSDITLTSRCGCASRLSLAYNNSTTLVTTQPITTGISVQ